MKLRGLIFSIIAVPVDIIVWTGAYILAYYLRSYFDPLPVTYIWPIADYIKFIIVLIPLIFATMTFEGLYNYRYPKRGLGQLTSIFISATAGVMYVVLWVFFTRSFFFSRLLIIYAWLLSIIFLVLGRWLIGIVQRQLYRSKIGLRKALIVGPYKSAITFAFSLKRNPVFGFDIMGIVDNDSARSSGEIRLLGKHRDLDGIIKRYHVDDVIIADSTLSQSELVMLSEISRDNKVAFHLTPNALQIGARKFAASTIGGLPVIEILETPLEGWANIVKRIFDIIGSIVFIALFSWLYIIVAIAVKLTSPGPVFYLDKRVGANSEFYAIKFRSFKKEYCTGQYYGGKEAEKLEQKIINENNSRTGPIPKIKNDPRVTSIGRFLRKTSVDEIPQFFNVLRGNMSIVGPRPHRPKEVAQYKPRHKKLFLVKPGITGMAQISGRSDLDFEDEADLDIYYIENWSVWLDFQIAWQTIFVVLKSSGAY